MSPRRGFRATSGPARGRHRPARRRVRASGGRATDATPTAAAVRASAAKVAAARANLGEAGVADLVEVLPGDARQTLATLDGPIVLVLLDAMSGTRPTAT